MTSVFAFEPTAAPLVMHFDPIANVYTTGTGQRLRGIHEETPDCHEFGCVIHHPTDPHSNWPTHWRGDRGVMERLCPHGVGHPDRDHLAYIERRYGVHAAYDEGVHGCDGCCSPKNL